MRMGFRTRWSPVLNVLVVMALVNLSGCGWFFSDEDDEEDPIEETVSYTLTILTEGTGTGTTTPGAGAHAYDEGTVVNISASASASSVFSGWSGDVDAGGNTVTMDGDKTITATFTLKTFTIAATAGGNGTIDPIGSVTVNYGSDRSFTFTPDVDYEVDTVTVDGQPANITGDSYIFTNVTADHTIDVTFSAIVAETAWSRTYGHADWDVEYHTYGLDVTLDGGYVFVSQQSDTLTTSYAYDFWVVRLDADGNILWEKGIGSTESDGDDQPYAVHETSDGGFIVAGETYSYETGGHYNDAWIIKLTSSGNIEWQYTYGGTGADSARDLKETFNSQGDSTGFLFVGYTNSFGAGGRDVWLVKLNNSGIVEKEYALGGGGDEYGRAFSVTPDGGFVLAADTQSFGAGERDVWVVKFNSSYSVQWEKTFGGLQREMPTSIECTDDGGYVVGAYSESFGAGEYDFWVFKLDSAGDVVWQYSYGGSDTDTAQDLAKTDDGGYVMTGWTLSFDVDSLDAWVVKLDDAGLIQWQKSYNVIYDDGSAYDGNEWAYRIVQAPDGGYAVSGDSSNLSDRQEDVWIFKTDSTGSLGSSMTTDTTATENATASTAGDTFGLSSLTATSAVSAATPCIGYDVTPDVNTQYEVP